MNIGVNPIPAPPVCNPAKTGTQTAPVLSTDPLCTTGTPSGFVPSWTNPIQYAWSCNNASQSVACTASYTPPNTGSGVFDLSIKKYIDYQHDAQPGSPVFMAPDARFNYVIRVTNEWPDSSTGVTTVKDTLPDGISLAGIPSGQGWNCSTINRTITCTYDHTIYTRPAYAEIVIPVQVSSIVSGEAIAGSIQNNAVVHNPNEALPCYADNRMPTGNESVCTNDPKNTDPAIIRVGVAPTGFDLSLKKYIGTGSVDAQPGVAVSVSTGAPDAQPGSPLSVNTGDRISYLISVTNSGPQASSGVTTVQDILPVGVTASGSATGVGWSCAYSGVTLTCTSSQVVGSGASYPLITVPVIVTATAGQSVTNIAAVDNPNETNRCNTDGSMPVGAGASCNKDPNNSDPAVITIPGGGGGGGGRGASHVGKVCVNGVISCVFYNSITACTQAGIPANLCYSADAPGQAMCAAQPLTCGGGGGGGSTSGGIAGRCGDGILQPAGADHTAGTSDDEECDRPGSLWCSNSCKVVGLTNPGANPIMDLWMTIPVLAGTKHLGYTWLDGTPGKVPFSDYRMVLGVGTKAFTLADTVGFGIRTQFQIPIMIEESKKICITSTGSSLSPQTLCTTFGEAVVWQSGIHRFQRFDGTTYVVLGNGDYQYQTGATFPYQQVHLNGNSNNINLFRWATQYTPLGGINLGPTLNSAFFWAQVGNDGVISLVACTGTNCAPTATVELVKFDVRVSSAMVSSIGSSSNRSIESFVNMSNPFTGFLGTTSMNTSTTWSNRNNSTNTSVNLPTIVGTTGNQSSSGVTDLERFSVNGNRNILAISGSLTIENCPNNTFVMTGIRTVIVTGDLVIKCNIGYGTHNDASWAWITKNGNIKVYNGTGTPNVGAVTNLAGVFVAVKDSVGGDITYTGSNTTQAILRIEGSLYGDATPLFNSRLYGRATGAYDILTTGTVISYSNRALVSPPPLLSQYLGAYSVQRVVQ
jgi:uncharacterized repeat protein (TIGR01451 family)